MRRRAFQLPYACRAALVTSATGWPAAGYGALAIWVAGSFAETGSGWIFGRPFLVLLVLATAAHQLMMGLGAHVGVPPAERSLRALDRVLAGDDASDADLGAALHAIVRLPVWNALTACALSTAVIVAVETLELCAAGARSPNLWLIARAGFVTMALYVSASLTLGELLTRPACRVVRRAAAQRGVAPYDGFVLARWWRMGAAIVPPVAALAVAVEIGRSSRAGTGPWAVLMLLSVLVAAALAWLHYESHVRAAEELAEACRALAAGEDGQLVTGSIDPALLAMAGEFNAAARRVGADRRASSERYRALFEGAGDAILLVDPPTGAIVEANARAERLFAVPRAELAGRSLESCLDDGTRERVAELALDRPVRAHAHMVDAGAVRADGAVVPVDVTMTVVQTGDAWVLQAVLRDVRERQRIERELREAARRFEQLYRFAVVLGDEPAALAEHTVRALAELLDCPVAHVVRLDGDRCVTMARLIGGELVCEGSHPIAGMPAEEVRARRAPCLFTDMPERFPRIAELLGMGLCTYLGVPIFDAQGDVAGIVIALDRRPRVFRENDLQLIESFARRIGQALDRERLARDREALTGRLLESDRVKTEFLGMMSHELRTPLNILLGYTRMLIEAIDDGDVMQSGERGEILQRMLAGGLHLGELVEDTLSVLRLEAGVVRVDAAPLALAEFFDELRSVDQLLRRPGEVVERWTVDADVPPLVTDRRKLRQVLTNLVGNARKFTDRGTIEVHAARAADGGVSLRVRDSGCGIGASHLPHVFDLYRQAPSGREHDGCGLGLYIVRRYVTLLGGRVSCTSTVGVGTTFIVELPASPAASAAAAA